MPTDKIIAGGIGVWFLEGEELEVTLNGEEVEVTLNGEEVAVVSGATPIEVVTGVGAPLEVDVEPGDNIIGGPLVMTGSAQNLNDASNTTSITIQNPVGNNNVSILDTATGLKVCHILVAGEEISVDISTPNNVYVSGTALETIYWMGIT